MTKQQLDEIRERVEADLQHKDLCEKHKIPSALNAPQEDRIALMAYIESLQGQLAEAMEVIRFYANKKNWCRGDAYDPSVFIGDDDEEWKGKSYLNGFKARAYLEKYPGKDSAFNESGKEEG